MFPHTKPPAGTQINPLHPLSRGLVGCWLFNEGAGSLANDISGNKNHGRLKNMAPNVQGSGWGGSKFGGSLDYDGDDDYVDVWNGGSLVSDEGSFIAWMKFNDIDSNEGIIRFEEDVWENYFTIYRYNTNRLRLRMEENNIVLADILSPHGSIGDTLWHQIVITQDGNQLRMYIDGINQSITVLSGADFTKWTSYLTLNSVRLGYGTGNYLTGSFNSALLYNRALSADEVKQLYENPFCNMMVRRPYGLYVPAAPASAIMNQFQRANIGADLYNGVFA